MTKTCALVFLTVLGKAHAGVACTPLTSCPKLSDGSYCPVNNVTEHADVNRDVKEIATHLKKSPPDYASAKKIYEEGMYSSKGAGKMRTLVGLAQKEQTSGGAYTNAFFSGALDLYGSIDAIWHTWIISCLDNSGACKDKSDKFRTYVINKALIGVVTAYATYETGAAIGKAASDAGPTDGGSAFAWDEAAAFYIGNIPLADPSKPGSIYSPWEFNWKRDNDFPDGSQTNKKAPPILNWGLKMSRPGTYNAQNLKAAELEFYRILAIAAIRSAIKYSELATTGKSSAPGFTDYYLAEGAMYWRSASGWLSNFNKTAVQEVDKLFAMDQTSLDDSVPCKVKAIVETLYADAGITCDQVGEWKDKKRDCQAKCSTTGKTLHAGDATYVDYCQPIPTTTMAKEASGAAAAGTLLAGLAALAHVA